MIQKGIIEQFLNRYQVKVRIPVYDKIAGSPTSTLTKDLSIAYINTIPGITPDYKLGDIVLVGFENENIAQPVILGLLYREEVLGRCVQENLNVGNKAVLPEDTTVGGKPLSVAAAGSGGVSEVYIASDTPPGNTDILWLDTSCNPPIMKFYERDSE